MSEVWHQFCPLSCLSTDWLGVHLRELTTAGEWSRKKANLHVSVGDEGGLASIFGLSGVDTGHSLSFSDNLVSSGILEHRGGHDIISFSVF